MSDYTPVTSQVRETFAHDDRAEYEDPITYPTFVKDQRRAFNRWLAAHDAEIRGVDPVALDALAERKAMAYHDSECLLRPEIRNAALEEAAEIAENRRPEIGPHILDTPYRSGRYDGGTRTAEAIRSAKDGAQ